MGLEQDIEDILHPIQERVAKALADAEAAFETEKAAIAAEVRAAAAAAVKELPALEADVVAAAKAVEAAVEAALAARGL